MSRIFCIIDGMTDSTFCVQDYPYLASMHLTGEVDTCCGHEPESLGCILRLLGVQEIPPYLRGYAEALGAGLPVSENDLILRGSWLAAFPKSPHDASPSGPSASLKGGIPSLSHGCRKKSLYPLRRSIFSSSVILPIKSSMRSSVDRFLSWNG